MIPTGSYIFFKGIPHLIAPPVCAIPSTTNRGTQSSQRLCIPLGSGTGVGTTVRRLQEFENKIVAGVYHFKPDSDFCAVNCRLMDVSDLTPIDANGKPSRKTMHQWTVSLGDRPSNGVFDFLNPLLVNNTWDNKIAALHSHVTTDPRGALYHYPFDVVLLPVVKDSGRLDLIWVTLNWRWDSKAIVHDAIRLTWSGAAAESGAGAGHESKQAELEIVGDDMLLMSREIRLLPSAKRTCMYAPVDSCIYRAIEVDTGYIYLVSARACEEEEEAAAAAATAAAVEEKKEPETS